MTGTSLNSGQYSDILQRTSGTISTVVVTGATGCVGKPTVAALARAGYHVRAAARRPQAGTMLGVESLQLDVTDAQATRRAVAGANVVVHLAACVHRLTTSAADVKAFWATNADASRRLADEARQAGASRLILASTVAVYGETNGKVLHESAECHPKTVYAQTKHVAEKHWIDAGGVVLRFAVVFGPFDNGSISRLLRWVRSSRGMIVGHGDNRKSMAYSENIADRIVALASFPGSFPTECFNVVDWSPTQQELIHAATRALSRKPPYRLPAMPAFAGATLLDLLNRLRSRPSHWRANLQKLVENTHFDGTRLDHLLHYRPRVSLDDGLAATIRWLE